LAARVDSRNVDVVEPRYDEKLRRIDPEADELELQAGRAALDVAERASAALAAGGWLLVTAGSLALLGWPGLIVSGAVLLALGVLLGLSE
jgi:hypothetical protein